MTALLALAAAASASLGAELPLLAGLALIPGLWRAKGLGDVRHDPQAGEVVIARIYRNRLVRVRQ